MFKKKTIFQNLMEKKKDLTIHVHYNRQTYKKPMSQEVSLNCFSLISGIAHVSNYGSYFSVSL